MNPTGILMEEHNGIKLMLEILTKVCDKLDRGDKIDPEHLEKILEFIRVFADQCHHGKEEDLLFPAMEKAGIPNDGGPIGVMLTEHSAGRDYVKKLAEGIEQYKQGGQEAISKIIENSRGYIELLSQHIDKEDNVLYPMADSQLTQEVQNQLVKDFQKVEEEKIGPGKHEQFHQLLNQLKNIYL